jgi:biopolymer transport protein TolR
MAMNVGKSRGAIAEINVTPMADVMIVLLIIFMVMTPLINAGAVPLPPAPHVDESRDPGKALVLVLAHDGALSIADQPAGHFEAALAQLTALAQADPTRPVWIKADRGVRYAWIASLLEACRQGGAGDITLATERPEAR